MAKVWVAGNFRPRGLHVRLRVKVALLQVCVVVVDDLLPLRMCEKFACVALRGGGGGGLKARDEREE